MPGEFLSGSSAEGPVIPWCLASLIDGPQSCEQVPAVFSQRIELTQRDHCCNLPSPNSSALWVVEGLCIICNLPSGASGHTASYHSFLQPVPLQGCCEQSHALLLAARQQAVAGTDPCRGLPASMQRRVQVSPSQCSVEA